MNHLLRILLVSSLCLFYTAQAYANDVQLPINLNTADAKTLAAALDGIGEKKAQAIIDYRDTVGPFKAVEELTEIKGIGSNLVKANRGLVVLK